MKWRIWGGVGGTAREKLGISRRISISQGISAGGVEMSRVTDPHPGSEVLQKPLRL